MKNWTVRKRVVLGISILTVIIPEQPLLLHEPRNSAALHPRQNGLPRPAAMITPVQNRRCPARPMAAAKSLLNAILRTFKSVSVLNYKTGLSEV
jgi:cytosine/adenosine deaminase-related metal-dependent hydrolase